MDEARVAWDAIAHQAKPCLKVACLAQGAMVRHAEFCRDPGCVLRADAEGNDCAYIAEDGVLQCFWKLCDVLVDGDK